MKLPWPVPKIRKSILQDLREFYKTKGGHGPAEPMGVHDFACLEVERRLGELSVKECQAASDQINRANNVIRHLHQEKLIECANVDGYVVTPPDQVCVPPDAWPRIGNELRPWYLHPILPMWVHSLVALAALGIAIIALIRTCRPG